MPKRTNDFQKLVTLVQQSLAPKGAKITESHLVDVPGQSEPREIDVLIESNIGLYRIKIAVEAKDEGRKLDSTKFEAIVGKYLIEGGVKVDRIVIVTHRGFYRPVIERAAKLGVELLTLREAEEMDWSQFVPQQLRLESTPSIHEIKISPHIEAISADSILRDGRIICSHGRNFGTPEHFAWHLFSQIVLRNQAEEIHDLDAAAKDKPDGSKARVDFSPDHEHVLRLNGEDHPIQHISFIVHFEHGKTVNPPAQQIRFAFPPHICRVELEPPIPDVPLKELRTAGRIICRCCGKDHGIINEFARRSMFERFFPSNPRAVKALEDGLKASPEGQVMLTTPWPLNHHVIRYNDHDYEVTTVKIGVHAIAATAQLNCKQYDLESANGEKKLISHLQADVGGRNIQIVMPDGVKSDKLVLRIDSSTRTA